MEESKAPSLLHRISVSVKHRHQKLLDDLTPKLTLRWIIAAVLFALYFARVFYLEGFYIVTYALGIFILNLFIAFLTPRIDPALDNFENDDDEGSTLPTKVNEEFRPFVRRLPEFKFWYSTVRAVLFATVCTFFEFCDVPVFWPILVMYFVVLFAITMKRQIKHMIKYRYLPFTFGKPKFAGKEDHGAVVTPK